VGGFRLPYRPRPRRDDAGFCVDLGNGVVKPALGLWQVAQAMPEGFERFSSMNRLCKLDDIRVRALGDGRFDAHGGETHDERRRCEGEQDSSAL